VGKNVAVFVDVANIFYAAKAAGVDIDYVTLLKAATTGRDLVRAYAYTGLDPENENQRNFHEFLRRSNYKVVSKDIRKYGDGKVKANLDIELVVDMMKTARNLDIAIVVSGDGDFAPAIRAVQEQGVRVEVISFRGNTSSDLIDVADQFTDIVQLARVEKGTRSGRRVADDDDLSMTEVPDKQTEGTGAGRGRGRRGRSRTEDAVAASSGGGSRGRGRTSSSSGSSDAVAASATGDQAGLVALPGERLSRAVGSLTEADLAKAEVFTLEDAGTDLDDSAENGDGDREEGDGQRRRRRRGGRGRGRGRGRADEAVPSSSNGAGRYESGGGQRSRDRDRDEDLDVPARGPKPTPFGSVWDSQLGTPPPARATTPVPIEDDEDFDEPEIPEYLIAEQRRSGRGQGGGGRGARGGRSAYQSAIDRERYGGRSGGGINRYPDVSGRNRQAPPREERSRSRAPERAPAPAGRSSEEPWSDVPPELEAMLRAQVAHRPGPETRPVTEQVVADAVADEAIAASADDAVTKPAKGRTTRKSTTAAKATTAAKTPTRARTTRKSTTASAAPEVDSPAGEASTAAQAEAAAPAKATRARAPRKTTAKATASADATSGDDSANPTEAAPKRRSTRKSTTTAVETESNESA
jgi:uncharacterized LabA/DUF88 family protein